jgi:predicted dehydrogenase
VRVGVVGCGYWGSKHVRVLQQIPAVSRVVVIDQRPERRAPFQQSASAIATFGDLDSALPDLDAVVVAVPPAEHFRIALQALTAGKHVLVEKPMTTTAASSHRLIEEAAARNLTLMVGHTFEYNAAVWKLREVIDSGELGEIYYIDTARLNLGRYQSDVNVLWDLAPHDISIINYLLRTRPRSVHAWGAKLADAHQEDVGGLRLGFGDQTMVAQIHVSWLDPCKVRRVTVAGSRKMAVYDDLVDQERLRIYDKGVVAPAQDDIRNPPMSYRHGGIFSPYIQMQEPLWVQADHFVECIRTGRRPRTDGESGLAVVQVLEAAARSLRQGTTTLLGGHEAHVEKAGLVTSVHLPRKRLSQNGASRTPESSR